MTPGNVEKSLNMTVFEIPMPYVYSDTEKPSVDITIGLYDTFADPQQFHTIR